MAAAGRNTSDPNHNPNPAALSSASAATASASGATASASAALRSQNSMAAAGGNTSDPNPNPNPFDFAASASGATVSASGAAASAAPRPQNSMEAPGGNTSDPNPNPNGIDVAEVMPATSPDAGSEFWNLLSMPERTNMQICGVAQKSVTDLYDGIVKTFNDRSAELLSDLRKINSNVMKLQEQEMSNTLNNYLSQNFVDVIQASMEKQSTLKVPEYFQEVLTELLDSEGIRVFEHGCKDTLFKQLNVTYQKRMNAHINMRCEQVSMSASSIGELEGKLVSASTTASKVVNALRRLSARMKYRAGLSKGNYESVFLDVLDNNEDVTWLCLEVDPDITSRSLLRPPILLRLLVALTETIHNEMPRKLSWMLKIVSSIRPHLSSESEINQIVEAFTCVSRCLAADLGATGQEHRDVMLIKRLVTNFIDRRNQRRRSLVDLESESANNCLV